MAPAVDNHDSVQLLRAQIKGISKSNDSGEMLRVMVYVLEKYFANICV